MLLFRSFTDRLSIALVAGLIATGIVLVGLQQRALDRQVEQESREFVEDYARDVAGLLDALPAASWATLSTTIPETSSGGVGLRVLGADGGIMLARGGLRDRRIHADAELGVGGEGPVGFVDPDSGERRLLGFQLPLRSGAWLQASIDPVSLGGGVVRTSILATIATLLVVLTFGIVGSRWLVRRDAKRLREILGRTERLSVSRRLEHVETSDVRDEIDRLAVSFNAMMDRLGAGVERMQRFSANVAHELRAPMARMRSRIELRLEEHGGSLAADRVAFQQTLADVERLNGTVRAMLQLAHSEIAFAGASVQIVSLPEILEGVIDFFSPVAEDSEVGLALGEVEPAEVAGDSNLLHELFGNLVDNAIKFSPSRSTVKMGLRLEGGQVSVWVEDDGPGIARHEQDRIFQAFQRLDRSAPGSGLGLPLAREIAHAHRGTVHVESQLGKGSRFVVCLPHAEPFA